MVIQRYYTTSDEVNKCEEPYRGVVGLIDQLYIERPDGCERMDISALSLPHVVSAVRTVYEQLKNNILIFNNKLSQIRSAMTSHTNIMRFDGFYLTAPAKQAVLFGAVYYLAAQDKAFSDKHLKNIEKTTCQNDLSTAMFQYFKKAADQKRAEQRGHITFEHAESHVLPAAVENDPSKRIVLTNQSETARVMKAMAMAGHFKHEDGSEVSEAEVGRKFCKDFGIKSSWDSLVQSAFKVENVSNTFNKLMDKATQHYSKVNNIKN